MLRRQNRSSSPWPSPPGAASAEVPVASPRVPRRGSATTAVRPSAQRCALPGARDRAHAPAGLGSSARVAASRRPIDAKAVFAALFSNIRAAVGAVGSVDNRLLLGGCPRPVGEPLFGSSTGRHCPQPSGGAARVLCSRCEAAKLGQAQTRWVGAGPEDGAAGQMTPRCSRRARAAGPARDAGSVG